MSTILSADDLNDFISPGVACIKPVEIEKSNPSGKAEIEIGIDGIPMEITENRSKQTLKSAQISLTDCLACSGCITSAETVLVSMQSHNEVMSVIEKNSLLSLDDPQRKVFAVSISHQVRVSLAAAFDLSIDEVDNKLQDLFITKLGFKYIVGTEIGRSISLQYASNEVIERRSNESTSSASAGPIICSSCPGWTCYVEKTHPHMIPYLSKVKSAQQITGVLLKSIISNQLNISQNRIYHVSIMPCFDKKLEAARPEFGEDEDTRDIDCVITSKEIIQLLLDKGLSFESLSSKPQYSPQQVSPDAWPYQHQWLSHKGSSSGGYLEHIISALITQRSKDPSKTTIEVIPGKNADTVEYQIRENNQTIARVAQIYGFRNIQNLVRKLKQKTSRAKVVRRTTTITTAAAASSPSDFDYIEVMACPGGCINGGGQIGKPDTLTAKEWKDKMETIYQCIDQHQLNSTLINQWIQTLWTQPSTSRLITANYQPITPTDPTPSTAAITLGTKW